MMYLTLTELRKVHPQEDEILLQYLVPATCKAAAVLGMVSAGRPTALWSGGAGRASSGAPEALVPEVAGRLRQGLGCACGGRGQVLPALAVALWVWRRRWRHQTPG